MDYHLVHISNHTITCLLHQHVFALCALRGIGTISITGVIIVDNSINEASGERNDVYDSLFHLGLFL